ncbi:MAG TPA: sugar phosphate nucleotidyltransferase [Candidatus Kapabacteria bacterium]|jgi:glucose-1-phosphate thymidylyltransferase|nr:sugar phosphate nucleotidyltransferase [Candidatus Kapabacteria bacterium]HOM04855.1 sugar phosphate nucleotidyltransferase [Candidatus Kapabacteria bacterium]HPU23333.1 sugar phosphate nucleotidyltransferase [Candidatus Kapabacteria bacterium]
MRAVIPVAGVGTRLRPHTYSQPKVLLNVAGKPILAHILDSLLQQGIIDATIITGYMGDLVEDFVTKKYSMMKVDFVEQKQMLGLGHAIWTGRDTYGNEPLLIILGDTIFDVDLNLAFETGYNSIGVKEVEDPRRFGVVITNGTNFIEKLVEKPDEPISKLAIVGLYFIKDTQKLVTALSKLISDDIRTRGEYQLTDALQLMIDDNAKFVTFPVDGWYDCGKPETLLSTNRFLLVRKPTELKLKDSVIIQPSFVSEKAVIERSIIGPYTSVADGAVVKDSIIKDSIISYGAKVTSSLLENSIVGNNAELNGHFHRLNIGNSSTIDHS